MGARVIFKNFDFLDYLENGEEKEGEEKSF